MSGASRTSRSIGQALRRDDALIRAARCSARPPGRARGVDRADPAQGGGRCRRASCRSGRTPRARGAACRRSRGRAAAADARVGHALGQEDALLTNASITDDRRVPVVRGARRGDASRRSRRRPGAHPAREARALRSSAGERGDELASARGEGVGGERGEHGRVVVGGRGTGGTRSRGSPCGSRRSYRRRPGERGTCRRSRSRSCPYKFNPTTYQKVDSFFVNALTIGDIIMGAILQTIYYFIKDHNSIVRLDLAAKTASTILQQALPMMFSI